MTTFSRSWVQRSRSQTTFNENILFGEGIGLPFAVQIPFSKSDYTYIPGTAMLQIP